MAYLDVSAALNYPDQENLNVGSSGNQALLLERFDGRVHTTVQKTAIGRGIFSFIPLVGTDTKSNNVMGNPTISKVVAGVEPTAGTIAVGKMVVQVKQPVVAKTITPMLAQIQDHLNILSRTPENFGKKMSKHEDITLLLQGIKSALYEHTTFEGTPTVISGKGAGGILSKGTIKTLGASNDELDPTKLEIATMSMHQSLAEIDIDPMTDGFAYMPPAQYFTLVKHDKLVSTDFSAGNANYAGVVLMRVCGLPIRMTNRILSSTDTVASPRSVDSIASLYGSGFETSATEAKVKVLWLTNASIQVAEAIPMTTELFWDQKTLCWYLQTYEAYGCGPDRTDLCGAVFAY